MDETLFDGVRLVLIRRIVEECRQIPACRCQGGIRGECWGWQSSDRVETSVADVSGCGFEIGNLMNNTWLFEKSPPLLKQFRITYVIGRLDIVT